MKFPTGKIKNPKTLHIDGLSQGIDVNGEEYTALADCKNVYFKDGILQSRKGISAQSDRILDNSGFGTESSYNYFATDLEFDWEGSRLKLITEYIDGGDTAIICLTHFVNINGTADQRAQILFSRLNSDVFYVPESIVFFKGKPNNGCGIYALAGLVNSENYTRHESRMYELSGDLSSWDMTVSSYIPTVYINGRGNRHEEAAATNQAFMGSPVRLESLNLLNPEFYAYYSTDGYSSSFRLPFGNLDNEIVTGRLYYSVSDYVQWTIAANKTSGTAKVNDVAVTMHINREKGIVYFRVAAGEWEVPLIEDRNENNLRFSAYKSCEYGLWEISCANTAVSANGKIFLGYKNTVFVADYENPLYFTAQSYVKVGDGDMPITALTLCGDRAVAFKHNRTYLLDLSHKKPLNTTTLLAENDAIFFSGDTLTAECISYEKGCPNPKSVIKTDNGVYWCDAGQNIHALFSGSEKIVTLSDGIYEYIKGNLGSDFPAFAVNSEEGKLFVYGSSALLMCQRDKTDKPQFYYWEFPQEIVISGGFNHGGRLMFICKGLEASFHFIGLLDGQKDGYLTGDFYDILTEELPVECFARTKRITLGCDNELKNINSVSLRLKAENAQIYVKDRLISTVSGDKSGEFKTEKAFLGLCAVNCFDIHIEGNGGFALGSIDVKYTPLEGSL